LIADANQQMDAFTALHRFLIMLIFLSMGLHHIFLQGIVQSFQSIPAGTGMPQSDFALVLISVTASIFSVALQLSAPILVALLFTMAGLGLIARTVPQMNVFTMSFPASFFIGLLVYAATAPFFPEIIQWRFVEGGDALLNT